MVPGSSRPTVLLVHVACGNSEGEVVGETVGFRSNVGWHLVLDAIKGGLPTRMCSPPRRRCFSGTTHPESEVEQIHSRDMKNVLTAAHGLALSLPLT